MSSTLHPECAKRLKDVIGQTLGNATVKHRQFFDPKSLFGFLEADNVIPQTGKYREALAEYISETPVFDFMFGHLARELHETQHFDRESPSSKLSEVEGYGDLNAVACHLVAEFESLPWEYTLTIPLPSQIGEFLGRTVKSFSFSDDICIVTPDDKFSSEYPLVSGIGARDQEPSGSPFSLLRNSAPPQWSRQIAHLQLQVEGFIGQYGTTTPIENAVALVKAFCGIGIALRLFKTNRTYRAAPSKIKFYIHRKISGKWAVEGTRELDSPQSDVYQDLVFEDHDGRFDTEIDKQILAQNVFPKIATVLSAREQARRIILAGEWLFNSYCGSDELLSFVQTAVVMEILLGDKAVSDLMGLSELLRNRCAYLISTTYEERERFLHDFRAIYTVRSNIVHAGKKRLNMEERHLFAKLQWMCQRVIQEEVKLLEKEVVSSA